MADNKKRVSELDSSGTNTTGLWALGVDSSGNSVKVPLGTILSQYDQALGSVTDLQTAAANAATTPPTSSRSIARMNLAMSRSRSTAFTPHANGGSTTPSLR